MLLLDVKSSPRRTVTDSNLQGVNSNRMLLGGLKMLLLYVSYCLLQSSLMLWGAEGSSGSTVSRVLADGAAEAPSLGTYRLIKTSAHDQTCFTQGYVVNDGYLYESCGLYGHSSLRKMDIKTGAVEKHYTDFSNKVFAEGITIMGDRLYVLTWQSRHLYVFDLELKHLFTTRFHSHRGEGWGLTTDGEYLIVTDGSSRIMYLRAPTKSTDDATKVKELIVMDRSNEGKRKSLREAGIKNLELQDGRGEVKHLNDLELVEGMLYLNVWYKDVVIVVDPASAVAPPADFKEFSPGVETKIVQLKSKIDMTELYPMAKRWKGADCLNGIAYDPEKKEFLLTGKLWPNTYHMDLKLTGGVAKPKGSVFQKKRRRRRTKTTSLGDRDLEGTDSEDYSSLRNSQNRGSSSNSGSHSSLPRWVPGLLVATGLACVFVCALLMLLVWIERGQDDTQQRYVYISGSNGGEASPQRNNNNKRPSSSAGDSGNFAFHVGADVDGVEMQMPMGSGSTRYVDRR